MKMKNEKLQDQPDITSAQLIALYEVSRKINSQLNLPKLLDEIMDLAIELLHAEKGVILLRDMETEELTVQVARLLDGRRIQDVIELSRSIVEKVGSDGKPILLQRVPDTQGKATHKSLIRYKIKSVICVPLMSKAQLIGTIYLDTTNSEHFFKRDDLAFLEGFANLAGIAIENARTYREVEKLNGNLEKLVEQRTQEVEAKHNELKTAYHDLKNAQMQLIRSEKMASLGHLVAGIAHEINTPLGSINSNSDLFIRCFSKLQKDLKKSDRLPDRLTKTMRILGSLAEVNQEASERITKIVKTLRNFARLDEEDLKTVDLHVGIDSTLALTAHLSRNRIEVLKEYGDIPPLRCYASQLNQVFMNLIVNACQAIADEGEIKIKTYMRDSWIHLEFSDSGSGIPPEDIDKIFDPGFTTKGVGVGTGLGLSISYKIIQEHSGQISVESELGKGTVFMVKLPTEETLQSAC